MLTIMLYLIVAFIAFLPVIAILAVIWFLVHSENKKTKQKEEEKFREKQIKMQEQLERERLEKEEKHRQLINAFRPITFFCPNCGILISDEYQNPPSCPSCQEQMKDAQAEVCFKKGWLDWFELDKEAEDVKAQLIYIDELYEAEQYSKVIQESKKLLECGHAVAQFYVAQSYKKEKNLEEYIFYLKQAADQGLALALEDLGLAYYDSIGVEKNNIFAQKYILLAAEKGLATSYYWYTYFCENNDFRWNAEISDSRVGYFKAAARGDEDALEKVADNSFLMLHESTLKTPPSVGMCRLWWSERAAELGSSEAAERVCRIHKAMCEQLSAFREYKDVDDLYLKYSELVPIWHEKAIKLQYSDEDCYQGYLCEKNEDFEKALEFYQRAAERNDQQAIDAIRRLTGNRNYKLKTGKLQAEDYSQTYQKAKDFFDSGIYEQCLIQARKTLEIYIHHLFYQYKIDMPFNDDLVNLIDVLEAKEIINEKQYGAMGFIRRKGNSAVHGNETINEELANQVMRNLTEVISDL